MFLLIEFYSTFTCTGISDCPSCDCAMNFLELGLLLGETFFILLIRLRCRASICSHKTGVAAQLSLQPTYATFFAGRCPHGNAKRSLPLLCFVLNCPFDNAPSRVRSIGISGFPLPSSEAGFGSHAFLAATKRCSRPRPFPYRVQELRCPGFRLISLTIAPFPVTPPPLISSAGFSSDSASFIVTRAVSFP